MRSLRLPQKRLNKFNGGATSIGSYLSSRRKVRKDAETMGVAESTGSAHLGASMKGSNYGTITGCCIPEKCGDSGN